MFNYFRKTPYLRYLTGSEYASALPNNYQCCFPMMLYAILVSLQLYYGYESATILKVALLQRCFSLFLNFTNGIKSRNASHINFIHWSLRWYQRLKQIIKLSYLSTNQNLFSVAIYKLKFRSSSITIFRIQLVKWPQFDLMQFRVS